MGDGWQWSLYSVCTHKHLQLVKVLSLTGRSISRILLQATDSPMLLSSLLHSSANLNCGQLAIALWLLAHTHLLGCVVTLLLVAALSSPPPVSTLLSQAPMGLTRLLG